MCFNCEKFNKDFTCNFHSKKIIYFLEKAILRVEMILCLGWQVLAEVVTVFYLTCFPPIVLKQILNS